LMICCMSKIQRLLVKNSQEIVKKASKYLR
jgi:hypothetical protein